MKKKPVNSNITDEMLAAYLDGNATAAECRTILHAMAEDAELRELLSISQSVDAEMGVTGDEVELLPFTAMAASSDDDCSCSLECEKYILQSRGVTFDEEGLQAKAVENRWLCNDGTALHNVGRLLEECGMVVERRFKCRVADISAALGCGKSVIAVVDGGELTGNRAEEIAEDLFVGQIPDHAVVVTSCDGDNKTVTIYDPHSGNATDVYPEEQFLDAWEDSKSYMVTARESGLDEYVPHPIDLSDVELSDELNELREAIAENAHEVWAENRRAEGWTYGKQRNDQLKQTPDMMPYSQLPDSEKEYDREMAMKTIKLLKKLGYDIVKRKKL